MSSSISVRVLNGEAIVDERESARRGLGAGAIEVVIGREAVVEKNVVVVVRVSESGAATESKKRARREREGGSELARRATTTKFEDKVGKRAGHSAP